MQDIQPIGGGGGRFYDGGGDRRLRPNNQHNQQTLKCPRCDSLNTKFCYYNNYNLSQPRHFCKSCRRYWTKGGVLRNVPVGGGCRKSKRSKPKSTPSNTADVSQEQKSNSHSSSESSSLTATTTASTSTANTSVATTTEVVSATSSNTGSTFINFHESNFFLPNNTNPSFDHHQQLMENSAEVQFHNIGNFTNPSMLGFNIADISAFRLPENEQQQQQWNNQPPSKMVETVQPGHDSKMEEQTVTGYSNDQTGRIEFTGIQQSSRVNNSELPSLDWHGENGMFDLTGTVDQSYWNQTQWGENDHSLNFLP